MQATAPLPLDLEFFRDFFFYNRVLRFEEFVCMGFKTSSALVMLVFFASSWLFSLFLFWLSPRSPVLSLCYVASWSPRSMKTGYDVASSAKARTSPKSVFARLFFVPHPALQMTSDTCLKCLRASASWKTFFSLFFSFFPSPRVLSPSLRLTTSISVQ